MVMSSEEKHLSTVFYYCFYKSSELWKQKKNIVNKAFYLKGVNVYHVLYCTVYCTLGIKVSTVLFVTAKYIYIETPPLLLDSFSHLFLYLYSKLLSHLPLPSKKSASQA